MLAQDRPGSTDHDGQQDRSQARGAAEAPAADPRIRPGNRNATWGSSRVVPDAGRAFHLTGEHSRLTTALSSRRRHRCATTRSIIEPAPAHTGSPKRAVDRCEPVICRNSASTQLLISTLTFAGQRSGTGLRAASRTEGADLSVTAAFAPSRRVMQDSAIWQWK
jgi:hypothetical protein